MSDLEASDPGLRKRLKASAAVAFALAAALVGLAHVSGRPSADGEASAPQAPVLPPLARLDDPCRPMFPEPVAMRTGCLKREPAGEAPRIAPASDPGMDGLIPGPSAPAETGRP